MSNINPFYGGVPNLWRLAKSDGSDGIEEVVSSIHGIICKKDLPPFLERIRYVDQKHPCPENTVPDLSISPNSKQIRYLRQDISITGLGLDKFQAQVGMIPEIAALFTRAVSEDKFQPHAIIGEQDGLTTLDTSNRYFTPKKDMKNGKELPFHPDMDPRGNLTRLLGTEYSHLEDNNVFYYERVTTAQTGDKKYAFNFFSSPS